MPLLKVELDHWFRKTGGKPFWTIERGKDGPIDVYLTDPEPDVKVNRRSKKVERR